MVEAAAHLVDRVLPRQPFRQWTFTLPWDLARRVAFDRSLCSAVFRIFSDSVQSWYEAQARDGGIESPSGGCILQIQRFADGATLWPHGHAAFLDGVYEEVAGSPPRFFATPPPTPSDLEAITRRIARRIRTLLRRRGLVGDEAEAPVQGDAGPGGIGADPALMEGSPLLLRCALTHESSRERVPGYEQPSRRARQLDALRGRARKSPFRKEPKLLANVAGFQVHADRPIEAHKRDSLERLLRYMARPPISSERIRLRDDGKVTFYLKRARRNGVNALVFDGVSLVARLAALIPPPGMNMRLFYGVFAANHPLRRRILPAVPDPKKTGVATAPPRPARLSWAELLHRVFRVDALQCPECKGRMRIVETIETPTLDDILLASLIISGQAAAAMKAEKEARAPPQFRWPSRTQKPQRPKGTAQ
jgi:hypothetical protein